jgi:hypothetical protein
LATSGAISTHFFSQKIDPAKFFANHHFAEAIEAVAAGGEHQLASVEKKLALHAAEHQLQLSSPPG